MLILRKSGVLAKKHYLYFWAVTKLKNTIYRPIISELLWVQSNKQKWVFNKVNKSLYTELTTPISNVILKSTPIWTEVQTRGCENENKTNFLLFTEANPSIWRLIRLQPLNSMFFNVIDLQRNKNIYIAGPGNYVMNAKHNKIKKIITFILPSKKQIVTSEWAVGLKGKNTFYLLKNYISTMRKNNLRTSKKVVRGVAKNPVDHHNGGRTKRKPLFLNKYNKVAKFNK